LLEGKSLSTLSERELTLFAASRRVPVQQAALFDSLNVFDNVAFGLRAKGGFTDADIASRVRERVLEVGLPATAEAKMPMELSGGCGSASG